MVQNLPIRTILSQVRLKQTATLIAAESTNSLLLDLTHTLTGEVELLANLLEGHLGASDAEEVADDVALTLGEALQSTLHLGSKRLVDKAAVSVR